MNLSKVKALVRDWDQTMPDPATFQAMVVFLLTEIEGLNEEIDALVTVRDLARDDWWENRLDEDRLWRT